MNLKEIFQDKFDALNARFEFSDLLNEEGGVAKKIMVMVYRDGDEDSRGKILDISDCPWPGDVFDVARAEKGARVNILVSCREKFLGSVKLRNR